MIDYSHALIELNKYIQDYRYAILKNDMDNAIAISSSIVKWANKLDNWTDDEYRKWLQKQKENTIKS